MALETIRFELALAVGVLFLGSLVAGRSLFHAVATFARDRERVARQQAS